MHRKKPSTLGRDLQTRVRQMMPAARILVAQQGIDDLAAEFTEHLPCPEPPLQPDDPREKKGTHVDQLITWTSATYALGIAVGLLLRPDAFTKGGGR